MSKSVRLGSYESGTYIGWIVLVIVFGSARVEVN